MIYTFIFYFNRKEKKKIRYIDVVNLVVQKQIGEQEVAREGDGFRKEKKN